MSMPQPDPNPFTPDAAPSPAASPPAGPAAAEGAGRRLTRSRSDRMLGGVCGGLARYFGIDATWVRIAFVVSVILPGPQVLLYLLLWLVIPQD
ncbi:hypothetical protein GCM10022231_15320 [Gordonia caeni]|uniref:Phage shock protein PspC N-terminal domain-containing protein n=2 Tax=Gordonia caeni TaxID=1007097 RepID=A0ABP7P0L8_9ACTN